MAIRTIKEIIDTKGYLIDSRDRAIFQENDLQSFFGLSDNDNIEFIVYDINDNQLPQENFGLVRYIPLTNDNINDYFLISSGIKLINNELPSEYFIDVEKLLKEAGYTNGIFKVHITLINNRAGSDSSDNKLRIGLISPSRTEIKINPVIKSNSNPELQSRFSILQTGQNFREDVERNINNFLETSNSTISYKTLIDIYGSFWVDRLKSDFKIKDLENTLTDIYNKFYEAVGYEFSNRISDIDDNNYGNIKETPIDNTLSVNTIFDKCNDIMIQIINSILPNQDIRNDVDKEITTESSIDDIKRIIQIRKNNEITETVLETSTITKPNDIIFIKQPNIIGVPDKLNERIIELPQFPS